MKKSNALALAIGAMCCGCLTEPVRAPEVPAPVPETPSPATTECSHANQPVYSFDGVTDGQHFIFAGTGPKLAASVNVKDGYLTGEFEIYYDTGIFKYRGEMDAKGHVVVGDYNSFRLKLYEWDVRSMTTADMLNAQAELLRLMRTGAIDGIGKAAERGTRPRDERGAGEAKVGDPAAASLADCMKADFHPVIGEVYSHNGERLQIFQVIPDAVMVRGRLDDLNIAVKTQCAYVDDEMLRTGKYEYLGPYTYKTVEDTMRTIRLFKEVE